MVKSVSCLAVAFGLFMVATSTDLAAQEPSSDMDAYVNQMNKLADIISGISTVEDVAAAEPQAKAVFDNLAEILLGTEDVMGFLEVLSTDEGLEKANERIQEGAEALKTNSPETAMAMQGMLERASADLMEALNALYMEGGDGGFDAEEYEGGM